MSSSLRDLCRPLAQACPLYWHLVANSGDLFKLVHLRIHPRLVASSSGYWSTYGRAVCILLEYFLVFVKLDLELKINSLTLSYFNIFLAIHMTSHDIWGFLVFWLVSTVVTWLKMRHRFNGTSEVMSFYWQYSIPVQYHPLPNCIFVAITKC